MSDPKVYFANLEGKELGAAIKDKVDTFYAYVRGSGVYARMRKSFLAYYGVRTDGTGSSSSGIGRGGADGELLQMNVNHYRNIAQHMLQLCTSQRPSPQVISSNTDRKSQAQAVVGSGLLDYYSREKRVERNLREAAEHAIVFGEGFIKTAWDAQMGSAYAVDPATGRAVHEGDLMFQNYTGLDTVRDPSKLNSKTDWVVLRNWDNKFNLAARFPEHADAILGLAGRSADTVMMTFDSYANQSDEVCYYELFHKKTPACPNGRYALVLSDDIVPIAVDMPYADVNVRRISPADLFGSPFGYTAIWDLLCIQEALNALYSAVTTNQITLGVQLIIAPKGHDIDYQMLARGLSFIEYDSKLGKPEGLNLSHTPQEIFAFIKQLENVMETISGINSTVRGDPQASLKSGSALALVQSQAIQFSTGLQQSYAQLVEDVFTDALTTLRDYAKTKRVVRIVGKFNQPLLKEFTGKDLESINRVIVDSGSALAKTASGRIQIAQDLLNSGLLKTPEEYLSVVLTGKLEPMVEGDMAELLNIRSENEALSSGKEVQALAIDSHTLHIKEHRSILANPELRSSSNPADQAVIQNTLNHIQAHVEQLKSVDPALLAILGEQSLAVPPAPPEQAAGGTPPKQGPNAGQPDEPPPELPQLEAPAAQPSYPLNPQSGQKWDPVTGGVLLDNGSTM